MMRVNSVNDSLLLYCKKVVYFFLRLCVLTVIAAIITLGQILKLPVIEIFKPDSWINLIFMTPVTFTSFHKELLYPLKRN